MFKSRYCYYSAFTRIAIILCLSFVACQNNSNKETTVDKNKDEFVALNDAIKADSTNAELYFKRAQIFFYKKDVIQQAYNDAAKAVSLDSGKAEYFMLLAEISFKGLQISKAANAFEKSLQLDPKNVNAALKLSELYLYIKVYPKCVNYANEALKIDKSNAKAYFLKGFAYKETGDTAAALSSFQTAVEVQPDHYDAYLQLGILQAALKNPIALQYYNNALKLRPSSTEALYDRGLFLQERNRLDEAKADYERILKIDPKYEDAYYNLGYIALVYKKDYQTAITHFTDAIRVNDQFAEAFYNRGMAYELSGDKLAAQKDFRAAVAIVPTYKMAKDKLKRGY